LKLIFTTGFDQDTVHSWAVFAWREAGNTPTGHQTITGLTHRDRQPFTLTLTPTDNLESPINLHVFGLLGKTRAPVEKTR